MFFYSTLKSFDYIPSFRCPEENQLIRKWDSIIWTAITLWILCWKAILLSLVMMDTANSHESYWDSRKTQGYPGENRPLNHNELYITHCNAMEDPSWRSLFLKDCTSWKSGLLHRSLWRAVAPVCGMDWH